ncbi:hypothetical protein L917_01119 [Phytophthora nicotianae]|uniref:Uncharacterized protein n=3 Tax=Phytophthora nicotianae TaxID=4792 RepID=V9FYM4_PHYNI|nr:hypothetical protein F443_01235 [Phytophthora nicotianae P1569]ETM02406.1 hypothetical protein L917_01119 [Phytophthora nicotianae]ETM55653.1 hypothetical protein L914_01156 [Phytophthora nicotianae]ETO59183.1 hypothetical protein F444_22447 [Phytophthora nicotianae P1976]
MSGNQRCDRTLKGQSFSTPLPTRKHQKHCGSVPSPATPQSKVISRKRLRYEEEEDKTTQSEGKSRTYYASKVLDNGTELSNLFCGWTKEENIARFTRVRALERERAERTVAVLESERKRGRRFHEVPGRYDYEKYQRIRKDITFAMMCESIAATDKAAGREPRVITRETFDK